MAASEASQFFKVASKPGAVPSTVVSAQLKQPLTVSYTRTHSNYVDFIRQTDYSNNGGLYVSKDREVYCEISFYQTNDFSLINNCF